MSDNHRAPRISEQLVLQVLREGGIEPLAHARGIPPPGTGSRRPFLPRSWPSGVTIHPSGWHQLYVEFTTWEAAEATTARHIVPAVLAMRRAGHLTTWWFLRKHPCWRFRLLPTPTGAETCLAGLNTILADLKDRGIIRRWWPNPYEPETTAFGGTHGMRIAHTLFGDDSQALFLHLTNPDNTADARSFRYCCAPPSSATSDSTPTNRLTSGITSPVNDPVLPRPQPPRPAHHRQRFDASACSTPRPTAHYSPRAVPSTTTPTGSTPSQRLARHYAKPTAVDY